MPNYSRYSKKNANDYVHKNAQTYGKLFELTLLQNKFFQDSEMAYFPNEIIGSGSQCIKLKAEDCYLA